MPVGHIFRSYDIRGLYGADIDENIAKRIGNVLGQISAADVAVGIDIRSSSSRMKGHFIDGIVETGKNVSDIGLGPLGSAMFYAWKNKKTLAYLTASHLPKEWAGIKFFHPDGTGFMDSENYSIRDMFLSGKFITRAKRGIAEKIGSEKVIDEYVKYLLSKLKMKKRMPVAADCGNGMSCLIAPQLFSGAGCDVKVIYGSLSETTERNPEPNLDALAELKKNTKGIGIAYDGDADRMIIVSDKKEILAPEKTAFVILSELMKEESGPVIANVECSRSIDKIAAGRKVIRVPVGHTFLAKHAKENGACFGLESSGHYIIPSLVPFDDALAVSLYACCAVSKSGKTVSEIVKDVPSYPFERINVECREGVKFTVIEKLKEIFTKEYDKINTMDGIRVDFKKGWILVRASNTSPLVRLTIEADSDKELEILKKRFLGILNDVMRGFA